MVQTDRIIQGGEELFLQAGIRSVTMDDIARHLGMSKKTIYQFFKDKNELVVALVRKKLKEDEDQMNAIISRAENVIDELFNMMKCSEEIFARINPVVVHDLQKYHPDGWKEFQQFKAEIMIQKFEQLLTKGIDQGYIRPEIDAKIIARMHVHLVEMGFNNLIFPITEFNTWKVQKQFLDQFSYGICTIKGIKLLNKYKNIDDETN
jgi:AcrR family transcriptional regulator